MTSAGAGISRLTGNHTKQSIEEILRLDPISYPNPYDAILQPGAPFLPALNVDVMNAYEIHRDRRNIEMKRKLLDYGLTPDPFLSKLLDEKQPDYVDPRNSLVFWTRPPQHVVDLAVRIQQSLKKIMPCASAPLFHYHPATLSLREESTGLTDGAAAFWLMPAEKMHTTVLEVLHSAPFDSVMATAVKLAPIIPELMAMPKSSHGCILCAPQISFDTGGVALSFVPWPYVEPQGPPAQVVRRVAGAENTLSPKKLVTIHHLRRELFQRITDHDVPVAPRYATPTAHITLGRFVDKPSHTPLSDSDLRPRLPDSNDWEWGYLNRKEFVQKIAELSQDLVLSELSWEIKEELVCRVGSLWYGDGKTFSGEEGREGGAAMLDKEEELREGPW